MSSTTLEGVSEVRGAKDFSNRRLLLNSPCECPNPCVCICVFLQTWRVTLWGKDNNSGLIQTVQANSIWTRSNSALVKRANGVEKNPKGERVFIVFVYLNVVCINVKQSHFSHFVPIWSDKDEWWVHALDKRIFSIWPLHYFSSKHSPLLDRERLFCTICKRKLVLLLCDVKKYRSAYMLTDDRGFEMCRY